MPSRFSVLALAGTLVLALVAIPAFAQDAVPPPPQPLDLFPLSVGGQPLVPTTIGAAELFVGQDFSDPASQAQLINAVLAGQGRSLDDLTLVYAYFPSSGATGSVQALWVRGSDMASLADGLLRLYLTDMTDLQITPMQIGDKQVVLLTDGPNGPYVEPRYAYAEDDILWIVQADEISVAEVIGQLPQPLPGFGVATYR